MAESVTAGGLQVLRDRVRELAVMLAATAKELGERQAEYELGLALDGVAMRKEVPSAGETANGTESVGKQGSDNSKVGR